MCGRGSITKKTIVHNKFTPNMPYKSYYKMESKLIEQKKTTIIVISDKNNVLFGEKGVIACRISQ